MQFMIPKELEPYFNALFPRANQYTWLRGFYHKVIRKRIQEAIEQGMFKDGSEHHQYPKDLNTLRRLQVLKGFFDPQDRAHAIYVPLQKSFKGLDHLAKELEDEYIKALARGDVKVPLSYGLPSYAPEVLREILTREILVYIQSELKGLMRARYYPWQNLALDLNYWCEKELGNLDPITHSLELDTRRFLLLHDPNAQDIDFGQLLSNAWYFLQGTDRIPLFLQHELYTVKRLIKIFQEWVHNLSCYQSESKLIGIGLPLAALWFMMGILYLCFAPYRFVRTMVNELSDLLKYTVQDLASNFLDSKQQNSCAYKLVEQILLWGTYLALLWGFGLPFLPNPFAWQPQFSLLWVAAIPVTFMVAAVLMGAVNSLSIDFFPESYKVFKDSANKMEQKVEQGLETLQKAHGELFPHTKRPLVHAFARYKEQPPAHEDELAEEIKPKFIV